MQSRQQLARDRASGLITALCLLYSEQALAEEDPFALPYTEISPNKEMSRPKKDATANSADLNSNYILFAEIRVNGASRVRLVQLRESSGGLAIREADAEVAGLIKRRGGDTFVSLGSLNLLKWNFDRNAGILSVEVARRSDGPNNIDMLSGRAFSSDSNPLTAFIASYDVTASATRNGFTAAGLVDTRFVRGDFSTWNSTRFATNNPAGQPAIVRLDSGATLNMPDRMLSATLGDFIGVGPASARAVRLGGLRFGTDFALRPDLVTYPLPDFTGAVAVPTGLDLVVNDRRFRAGDIEAGEFTVRNVPVPVGRGKLGVIVRDFLGRERVDAVNYYTSRALLAKGLSQYGINVGAVRRNYGRLSNDYGPWAATAYLRHGISNRLTVEPMFELAKGFASVGFSSTLSTGNFGMLNLDARTSRLDASVGSVPIIRRRGSLFGASFESVGDHVSIQIEARKVSKDFDDIASVSGDRPSPSFISSSINFDLETLGNFRLTAVRQKQQLRAVAPGEFRLSNVLTASYRKSFRGINLFVDATHQRSDRASTSLLFGIFMQFGSRTNAQANVSHQGGNLQANAGLYRLDAVPGEVGYAVTAGAGNIEQGSALVAYRGEWGRVEAQAEVVEGMAAARVSAGGSLLFADGHLFASRRLDNGFALVRTGKVGGVGIEQENRLMGRTSRSGYKLLTDFPAYVPQKIAIDPKSLPDMAVARKLSAMIVIPARSGTVVDLDVEHFQPVLFRLVHVDGRQVSPGTVVQAFPSKSEYIVGFDGMIEINGWHDDDELRFQAEGDRICFASFSASKLKRFDNDNGDTPEIRCDGSMRPLTYGAPVRKAR